MIELLHKTGQPEVDRLLRGVIGIYEIAFPDRVQGYYLRGSHLDGTAHPGSDVDIDILFEDSWRPGEANEAFRLQDACNHISPKKLDLYIDREDNLQDQEQLWGMRFRCGSALLFGQDTRDSIPIPPQRVYAKALVLNAQGKESVN